MRRKMFFLLALVAFVALFAFSASAAVTAPQKPALDVDFGSVTTIDGFTPPSQQFVKTTQRVLLVNGDNYVTYPTYYITKDSTTFDVDFENLNAKTGITYTKASIVMLEIPHGITTMTNQYFAYLNFENLLSCQIPGSVTNYGSALFWKNAKTKIVEFLDGTGPVTMGNEMFGGSNHHSYGGDRGVVVEYVKFPNNLTSIGTSTFYQVSTNLTIILGENLTSVGTGFIRASGWGNVISIYASSKFFGSGTEMAKSTFQSFNGQWGGNQTRLAIFFTGTKAEAEAFISKGYTAEPGIIFDEGRYQLVSANDYNAATHTPPQTSNGNWGSLVMVYGVSTCDAFYGNHNLGEISSCMQSATCSRNCGYELKSEFTKHNVVKTLAYPNGFDNAGVYNCYCTNADYCKTDVPSEYAKDVKKDPIIVFKGYSVPETAGIKGINAGFEIDKILLTLYEGINEDTVKFNLLMVNSETSEKQNISAILNGEELAADVKGINIKITSTNYCDIDISVRGFDDTPETGNFYTLKLITALAVTTKEDTHFVQGALKNLPNTQINVSGTLFNIVTADKVYTAVGK